MKRLGAGFSIEPNGPALFVKIRASIRTGIQRRIISNLLVKILNRNAAQDSCAVSFVLSEWENEQTGGPSVARLSKSAA